MHPGDCSASTTHHISPEILSQRNIVQFGRELRRLVGATNNSFCLDKSPDKRCLCVQVICAFMHRVVNVICDICASCSSVTDAGTWTEDTHTHTPPYTRTPAWTLSFSLPRSLSYSLQVSLSHTQTHWHCDTHSQVEDSVHISRFQESRCRQVHMRFSHHLSTPKRALHSLKRALKTLWRSLCTLRTALIYT